MPHMVSQIGNIIDILHKEDVAILLVERNVPLTLQANQHHTSLEKGLVRHRAASKIDVNDPVIKQYLGVCDGRPNGPVFQLSYDQLIIRR